MFVIIIIIHHRLFPTETAKDKEFEQKARSLWFVSAEHLDVPSECLDHFAPIVAQLQRIGEYKTPGNKLFVVSEVCKALYSLCSRKDRKACSTDDFLPCLIFVVLKSGLRNVVSTLEYIQNCHSPLFLQKEALYYLTNMLSAVGFIQGVSEKSLSIRKSTYDRLCSLAPPTGLPSLRPDLSVAYTFGDVSPCDLRVGDIPNLLDQYKELLEFFSKHQHEKKDSTNNDNNNYKMKN